MRRDIPTGRDLSRRRQTAAPWPRSRMRSALKASLSALLGLMPSAVAAGPPRPAAAAMAGIAADAATGPRMAKPREIHVPWDDLHMLLENQPRRVMMTRAEFDALWAQAHRAEQQAAPRSAAITSADYRVTTDSDRALIVADLAVEVLTDGVHAIPLTLGGVGLRRALLDDEPAAIGAGDDGRAVLFVEGRGPHALVLEMVTAIETTAAQQCLNFELPTPAATRLRLQVPGDVAVKSGAHVIQRQVDALAGVTRFELLPQHGPTSVALTLNNRLQPEERMVIARQVAIDEITASSERLQATFSMDVLHQAVDRFQFAIPGGFEVTAVDAPLLAHWGLQEAGERRVLEVFLREPARDRVTLTISALRCADTTGHWRFPALHALQVQGQMSVLGVLVDPRLRVDALSSRALVPIDAESLAPALPETRLGPAGAEDFRPVAAFYAPAAPYELTGQFSQPQPELAVTTNVVLSLDDREHTVRGGFALLPRNERLFEFDFTAPAGWQVTQVTSSNGQVLPIEHHAVDSGGTRIHVRLPQSLHPGQQTDVYFQAVRTPPGWLDDWGQREVQMPVFLLPQATQQAGAAAVATPGDFTVRPEQLQQLTPLDESEKPKYGLAGVETDLAYRFDQVPYGATLVVQRVAPRMTAQTYSFLMIEAEQLRAHYEVVYEITEARSRQVTLRLPESTPDTLSIQGLGGIRVKEFSSSVSDGLRHWTVLLENGQLGTVRLGVDFQQARGDTASAELLLPVVQAGGVVHQSGLIAVEGSADLEVEVDTDLAAADIGQLIDCAYQPGRRLLGVYAFTGSVPRIAVGVARPAGCTLPAVIVEHAELLTLLSAHGVSQSAARFQLRTRIPFLEVRLPDGSSLWSVELDGAAARPQRHGDQLLLSLPAADAGRLHSVQLVYETPVSKPGWSGDVELAAPRLMVRETGSALTAEVPMADLRWQVTIPRGYRAVTAGGPMAAAALPVPRLAISQLGEWLYHLAGGVHLFYDLPNHGLSRAREFARPAAAPSRPGGAEPHGRAGEQSFVPLTSAQQAEKDGAAPAESVAGRPLSWVLEGVRSLKIELQVADEPLTFSSLGENPRLTLGLSDVRRLDALGWGLALAVVVAGLRQSTRPVREQCRFVLLVAAVATLLPAVTASPVLTSVLNRVFLAAAALVPLLVAVGAARRTSRLRLQARPAGAALATMLALAGGAIVPAAPAHAQSDSTRDALHDLLQPPPPVVVPADAILLPYDPTIPAGADGGAEPLLVPYETFVKLYEQVHAQPVHAGRPPAPFALAGSSFSAVLDDEDSLLLAGRIDIEVLTADAVMIPLPLEGGVLARAELDGTAARLSVARPQTPLPETRAAEAGAGQAPAVVLLHVRGRGRHVLALELRMNLQRQGGWRAAAGRLPAAAAAVMTLRVPRAHTEVQQQRVADRQHWLTDQPDETIETVLGENGAINVRWRPRIAAGQIDATLTAESSAVLDVQEDGLRLSWGLILQFRGGERRAFTVLIPDDYLVARVTGDNVRGWAVEAPSAAGELRRLEVALLKPATDREEIALELWRQGAVTAPEVDSFQATAVQVAEAARHRGELTVRRSRLLEIHTVAADGLARTDLGPGAGAAEGQPGPLGLEAYEAYRFASTPFTLKLSAAAARPRLTAEVQALLRIAEQQRRLEARFGFQISGRSVYELQVLLPDDLDVEQVLAPGSFEWYLAPDEARQRLHVRLASGLSGEVPVIVRGSIGARGAVQSVPLPQLQALDVERQHGTIVVQVDPLYDVRPVQLSGCEWTAGAVAAPWLDSAQRPLARLALHYETPAYGGTLNLQTRAPVVTCTTITNVRVTDRLMEETILLDFDIATAGVRSVVFLLPRRMQDARVEAPLLRLKTLEPVERDGGDFLRVRLDLQDAVTGQLRVLIHQDLALVHEPQAAPIPIVETGSTAQRYVVLENSGRGELIVESPAGFEELGRQQQAWRTLAEILGSQPTQAFVAGAQAAASGLTYHVKQRTAVQTAGARIGLAETWLVVDDSGAYRGVQDYHVDNTTEQFLEIQLPDGAALWSVRAADVMVKPVDGAAGSAAGLVRIPLVKTAAGDLDYLVRLTYAGRLAAPGGLRNTEFPLLHTVNINVELSQVRLLLPETCAWMNFGGTMRRVDEEGDLAAGYLGYQTKQAQRLTGTLQSAEEFSQVRALANLKLLESELLRYQHSAAVYAGNDAFRMNSAENAAALDEARRQYQAAEERLHGKADGDNRQALGRHFVVQSISRAGEAVNELEFNFTDQISIPERDQAEGGGFDQGWFEDNDLNEALGVTTPQSVGGLDAPSDGPAAGAAEKPRLFQLQKTKAPDAPATPQMIQQMDQQAQAGRGKEAVRGGSDDKKTVARYKAALEQEAGAAGAGPPAADDEAALREEGLVAGGRYDRAGFGGSLVSLDVEIPRRGREYLFTTPRGDARIHSRAVSHRTIEILGRVGLLALAAALTWGVVRSTRGLLAGTAAARRASAVLIALGGLSVIAGILPLAGLAAVVAGIALRRRALAGGGSAWLRQVTS